MVFCILWAINLDTSSIFFRGGYLQRILNKKLFSTLPLSKLGLLTVGTYLLLVKEKNSIERASYLFQNIVKILLNSECGSGFRRRFECRSGSVTLSSEFFWFQDQFDFYPTVEDITTISEFD
jgi:hypothetical protein